ncbi:hypothetical protein Hanom_Chr14g01269681 [Helianthus anomalus]
MLKKTNTQEPQPHQTLISRKNFQLEPARRKNIPSFSRYDVTVTREALIHVC